MTAIPEPTAAGFAARVVAFAAGSSKPRPAAPGRQSGSPGASPFAEDARREALPRPDEVIKRAVMLIIDGHTYRGSSAEQFPGYWKGRADVRTREALRSTSDASVPADDQLRQHRMAQDYERRAKELAEVRS